MANLLDKQIKKEFAKLRKATNKTERKVLALDIKGDRERDRLKRKLQKS
jgi:hypothetical protein